MASGVSGRAFRWRLAACAGAAASLAGCGAAGGDGPGAEQTAVSSADAESVRIAPLTARGAGSRGLETAWYVVEEGPRGGTLEGGRADAERVSLGAALAAAGAEDALPTATSERWRRMGVRLVRVREGRLLGVMESAPPRSGISRDRLGERVRWTPAGSGTALAPAGGTPVRGFPDPIDASGLRWLVRLWADERLDDGAPVVRLELIAQAADGRRSARRAMFADPLDVGPEDAGELIGELSASLELEPGWAYLLTGAGPEEELLAPSAGEEGGGAGGAERAGRRGGEAGFGPAVRPARTVGEVWFVARSEGAGPTRRGVWLLTPRVR